MIHKITEYISEEQLEKRIRELAAQISKDYAKKEIRLICILKGSVFYTCELAKRITVPITLDFMSVMAQEQRVQEILKLTRILMRVLREGMSLSWKTLLIQEIR